MKKLAAAAFCALALGCQDVVLRETYPVVTGVELKVFSNVRNDPDSLVRLFLSVRNGWRDSVVAPRGASIVIECPNDRPDCQPRTVLRGTVADGDTLRFHLSVKDPAKDFAISLDTVIRAPGYGVLIRHADMNQYYFRVTWFDTDWEYSSDATRVRRE